MVRPVRQIAWRAGPFCRGGSPLTEPGRVTLYTRCDQCRNIEAWTLPDDGAFIIPPCELCGSDEITLADYHPSEG